MNNYIAMDRASEAAARDLAEVRKLIEGMGAFINQQPSQPQQTNPQPLLPPLPTTTLSPPPSTASSLSQQHNIAEDPNLAAFIAAAAAAAAAAATTTAGSTTTATATTETTATTASNTITTAVPAPAPVPAPAAGIVVQVEHLTFNRTLYFQLTADATIEPLVAGLRMSFNDNSISGMVLQYKGFDGLWKCLLNRDDSLRRILKQGIKNQAMLQMRVPREHDLLTSGYTDRRLLALTKPAV